MLSELDTRPGEVLIRGVMYEVGASDVDGSAFRFIAELLGGELHIALNPTEAMPDVLRLKSATVDVIASMLSRDSRFRVISAPSLRIRSGEVGTFSVGQDVPVLSAVNYDRDRYPVQSIEYRSSGVLFNVTPTVHEQTIDVAIEQTLSNFVRTQTGVNGSPTLNKRTLRTRITAVSGDIVILGGLAETKQAEERAGASFLPDILRARNQETNRTEIVLVLYIERLDGDAARPSAAVTRAEDAPQACNAGNAVRAAVKAKPCGSLSRALTAAPPPDARAWVGTAARVAQPMPNQGESAVMP
jgi:general secretion pathway protein D